MTDTKLIRAAFLAADKRDIEEAAETWSNCACAQLDADGDIYVSNPTGDGRWLNADDLVSFHAWCEAQ